MTKSTITRERIQRIIRAIDSEAYDEEEIREWLSSDEIMELSRMALAAMDSEPVFTLEVSQADYKGQKLGNHFGFITLDAARNLKEGNYQLYRHAQAAPVVPDEKDKTVDADDHPLLWSFNEGWNACRAAMLKAQPQNAPQNIPEIIPGWIPVSEQMPDCWCLTCRPVVLNDMRFVVCPDCGNKRCPRANDHRNACTGSNEPGQEGSAYPDTLQEPKP
ncbi:hypothetical protein M1924_06150 [Klebsiella pneumoniae]|nr:hypothetical protein [Klebsiella pneumoniae]